MKPGSNTLLGIGLMVMAMIILPFLDFCAKALIVDGMSPFQVVWSRLFFGSLLTLPFLLRQEGPEAVMPNLPFMHSIRAALLVGATACFFAALHYQAVATTLAIFFVQPLVTTVLSPFVLGEQLRWQRALAAVIGFVGTLVIIRPGFKELNPGVFLALASGVMLSFYMMLTRKIQGRGSAIMTNFHTNFLGVLMLSAFVWLVWMWPSPQEWLLMFGVGVIASTGHFLVIRAFDHAEASLLAPFAYTEMITSVLGGWYFFSEFPDSWTFAGVGILVATAIAMSLEERRRSSKEFVDFEQP